MRQPLLSMTVPARDRGPNPGHHASQFLEHPENLPVVARSSSCGTGLPTKRECLQLLGCDGAGKARAFAEICAAVVLAGETSLACAVCATG